jgi:hypothetical protein
MNLPPTRERAPSREARQAPSWRGLAPERRPTSGDPRAGWAPQSGAPARARPCQFAAAGAMAANDKPPPEPRDLRRVPRKTAPIPKHPRGHPTGPDRCLRPPQMAATTRFTASFCHSGGFATLLVGLARGWARHAGGPVTGRLQLCCPSETRLPKRRTRAMAARSGARLAAGQKRMPAATRKLHRPPTRFFVPGAFT